MAGSDEGESFDDDPETPAKYAKVSQLLPSAVSDENASHDSSVTMRTLIVTKSFPVIADNGTINHCLREYAPM